MSQLGQAEVEDLDAAILRHEDVLGLQVPMHDPFLVRGGQPVSDLEGIVDGLVRGERSLVEAAAERFALEQLLDDVGSAFVGSDVVDRGDVGMVQDAGSFGLLLEAAQAVGVRGKRRRQDLDRDISPEPRVLRPIDLPHSARAEGRDDLVRAEPRTGSEAHGMLTDCRPRLWAVEHRRTPSGCRVHLQPGAARTGRQRVQVLREKRDLPHLPVGQGLAEGRHAGKANSVGDLPVDLSLGIVLDPVFRELRRVRRQAFRDRRNHAVGASMAQLTLGAVERDARDEIVVRGLKRGLQALGLPAHRRVKGALRRPLLQPARRRVLSGSQGAARHEEVAADNRRGDGRKKTQDESLSHDDLLPQAGEA